MASTLTLKLTQASLGQITHPLLQIYILVMKGATALALPVTTSKEDQLSSLMTELLILTLTYQASLAVLSQLLQR